jgi:GH18 family chitinase
MKQGPFDNALLWTQLSASQRSKIKSQYNAAGIKLAVSAFGSTDKPTTQGYEPVALANKLSKFVKDYNLDGVDIDYEVCTALSGLRIFAD